MSTSNISNNLNIKIRTVTPVSVGADKGDVLSPYADFVFSEDGSMLHYLNLAKVEDAVSKQGKLEEYVRGIRSGMSNNRSDFSLFRFLTENLKLDLDDITRREVPQFGLASSDRRNINPTIKNANQPYIPGSTIKGALRTAILYDWLVKSEEGEKPLADTAAALAKITRTDPKNKKDLAVLYEQVFDETLLFGSLKSPFGPDARFLRVSDSIALPAKDLSVYALKRIRLKPGLGKSAIPQVVEAIPPQRTLTCSISVDPWLREMAENSALDYLADGDFEAMFQNINVFSQDCIANELFELQDANTRDFEKEVAGLKKFYENLQRQAKEGRVFIRLGFGKTVNDNSLTLALANGLKDLTAFNQFRAHFHKLKRDNELFPITRTISPDGQPLGWVEITPA